VPEGKTKKSKASTTPNQPFRRVDLDTSVNPKLADNSFEAKVFGILAKYL